METSKNILVVDDKENIRYFMKIFIEEMGFEATEAEDGKQALEIVNSKHVDLVISDVDMPEMNGIQLLKAIKAQNPCLPFIMMTGSSELYNREIALEMGADDYLPKPFQLQKMEAIVEKMINSC